MSRPRLWALVIDEMARLFAQTEFVQIDVVILAYPRVEVVEINDDAMVARVGKRGLHHEPVEIGLAHQNKVFALEQRHQPCGVTTGGGIAGVVEANANIDVGIARDEPALAAKTQCRADPDPPVGHAAALKISWIVQQASGPAQADLGRQAIKAGNKKGQRLTDAAPADIECVGILLAKQHGFWQTRKHSPLTTAAIAALGRQIGDAEQHWPPECIQLNISHFPYRLALSICPPRQPRSAATLPIFILTGLPLDIGRPSL